MSGAAERSKLLEKGAVSLGRGDLDTALKIYAKVFDDDPRDWNVGNTLGDLYIRMARVDEALSHFTMLAEQLAADGFIARARALYRKILRLQPDDEAARLRVDELDRQQVGTSSPFLKRVLETARTNRESVAGSSPAPAPAAPASAVPAPAAPATPMAMPALAAPVVPPAPAGPLAAPPPSFAQVEAAVNEALARGEFREAAAHIGQFVTMAPDHVAALETLVDICVDGGLVPELVSAQQRLSDACVRGGLYRQAFDIALDLCAREPLVAAHRAHAERVAAMARERGVALTMPRVLAFEADVTADLREIQPDTLRMTAPALAPPAAPPPVTQPHAVAAPPPAVKRPDPVFETPLLAVPEGASPIAPHAPIAVGPPFGDLLKSWSDPAHALEDIQQALLEEAAAQSEEHFAQATRLIAARQFRDAIAPLEDAMCVPHLRATAGSRLARVYRDTGAAVDALELLEWVAEMPPADEEGGHELAYELALTLEAIGQESQALGVYLELLAEVGPSYRDIATRAQRLTAA